MTPLLQSPKLPDYVRELRSFLDAEDEKRKAFYRELRDDEKVEFINGEVVCHSPAKDKHNFIRQNLEMILVRFVRRTKSGIIRSEKALVKLTRNDFEPDLCFFRKEVADGLAANTMFYPAPDFVVEVLSESTEGRDRGVKMEDYAFNGVQEYWLVHPDKKEVEQYVLTGQVFGLKAKMDNGAVRCEVLKGLEIPLEAIFDEEANERFLLTMK